MFSGDLFSVFDIDDGSIEKKSILKRSSSDKSKRDDDSSRSDDTKRKKLDLDSLDHDIEDDEQQPMDVPPNVSSDPPPPLSADVKLKQSVLFNEPAVAITIDNESNTCTHEVLVPPTYANYEPLKSLSDTPAKVCNYS
jgi:hypothetical protein